MAKNIAFFADGTWDEPANHSNVSRLYSAVAQTPNLQLATYDTGVGTGGEILNQVLGGAFGLGLFQKVKQGYSTIASQYAPGDRIFVFGFSRGAYTARSLAGMIASAACPPGIRTTPSVSTWPSRLIATSLSVRCSSRPSTKTTQWTMPKSDRK